jgi:predicted transcriptional regulator
MRNWFPERKPPLGSPSPQQKVNQMSNQRHPEKVCVTYSERVDTKRRLQALAKKERTNCSHLIREATSLFIDSQQSRFGSFAPGRSIYDDLQLANQEGHLKSLGHVIEEIQKTPIDKSTENITYTEWRDTLADLDTLARQEMTTRAHIIKKATFIYLADRKPKTQNPTRHVSKAKPTKQKDSLHMAGAEPPPNPRPPTGRRKRPPHGG